MQRDVVLFGDALSVLKELPDNTFQLCVTSPPFWNLRDYGTGTWEGGDPLCQHLVRQSTNAQSSTLGGGKKTVGHSQEGFRGSCRRCGAKRIDVQIGLESTPEEYIGRLVEIFREVRRVLTDTGVMFVNIGDSYYSSDDNHGGHLRVAGLKVKDLVGVPWMLAFALRSDGWWLRSEVIWLKPNAKPEAVKDRPTRAHEHVFLLSKSPNYFYDAEAVQEPAGAWVKNDKRYHEGAEEIPRDPNEPSRHAVLGPPVAGLSRKPASHRNRRSVWSINTKSYRGYHRAAFPPELPEVCIKAGSRPGDLVLDPFAGSGTTLAVAKQLRRGFVGIELNHEYGPLIQDRLEPIQARNEQEDLTALAEEMG